VTVARPFDIDAGGVAGTLPRPVAVAPAAGRGEIEVVRRPDGRSVVARAYATSPLRLLTPINHGHAAWIYGSSYGGGLVDGDAVTLDVEGQGESQVLRFTTNVDDQIEAGLEHPLRVVIDPDTQEPSPYLRVRTNLEALIHRNVFYQLVELAVSRPINGQNWLGVWSGGEFFRIGREP